MMSKPRKRIAIVDVGDSGRSRLADALLSLVSDRYEFEFTNARDAEYVFHASLGYEVLNYSGIRIFMTGECVSPNFNISDYALAYDAFKCGDRYCRFPNFKTYRGAYESLCAPRPPASDVLAQKNDFCAYVMSNTKNSAPERIDLFDALSKYKTVHSGGRWNNNVGGRVADKIAFQSAHKFVIAFENCSHPGYMTEKFPQAAQSNAVPIYWGDPDIEKVINPRSFINCHNFDSIDDVVARVKQLDNDDQLYLEMLSEPWFHDGVEPDELKDEVFVSFISNVFDQPHERAYRRSRGRWGKKTEAQLLDMAFRPHNQVVRLMQRAIRKTDANVKRQLSRYLGSGK
jgi:alpha(1,3/1,4) fucosyltransferase